MSARLVEMLRLTPFARAEFNLAYEPTADQVERARRLVILSFMGFGSNGHNSEVRTGFRSNSNRSGTTPAMDWVNFPAALQTAISRLRGVVIEQRDALEVIEANDGLETLHFVDPPYVAITRGPGTDYRYEMDDAAHRQLADMLHAVRGGGSPQRLSVPALRRTLPGVAHYFS